MSDVVILATIQPKPGMEAEVKKEFTALLEPTHREKGCELYALHECADKPGRLIFVERWSSQADLDAHAGSDHIAACMAACEGKLEEPVKIIPLDPIPGGDVDKSLV